MKKSPVWASAGCLFLAAALLLLGARQVLPVSLPNQTSTQISTPILILDAGHGGEDGGAVDAGGNKESDLNLAIVLRLEALMTFLGTQPVLTRREDISLHESGCATLREKKRSDLQQRVTLINSTANAMLISVHQNYFTDSRYSGAQVFYAQGDISRQWGAQTQLILRQVLDKGNDRKAAGLSKSVYLFDHIGCPAILVECGFLSNGEEASLLLTDNYQKKITVALAGAYLLELQMLHYTGGT